MIFKNLNQFEWAINYNKYLEYRNSGLKSKAKIALASFKNDFKLQDKPNQRLFIDSLCRIAFFKGDTNLYLPFDLWNDVIKVEIELWITDEPKNPTPLKWSNKIVNQIKGLGIDSHDDEAIILFGKKVINMVGMNQHELQSGLPYQGNPKEDLELLKYLKGVVCNLKNTQQKDFFIEQINDLEKSALKS